MNYRRNDKGEIVIKYTCGVAYFFLPFFFAAHAYAHIFHYNTSGFSDPYYYAMLICGVFWAFVGLYLLRILLLRFFSYRATWITLLCIMLGTNFFHYSTKWMCMPHVYSFVLAAAILIVADNYYKKPSRRSVFLFSLLIGWHILIRPTNCIFIVAVLLLHVASWKDFKDRIVFLSDNIKDIALAIPFLFLPMIPQLLYWKEMMGKWVVYSYKGENFIYWKNPKILAVLVDPLNGWMLYSPVVLFALPGLFIAKRDERTNSIAVVSTFILITYVFASWWAWNFGEAFGHRCYIEYLPLFAFPIAVTIEKVFELKQIFLKTTIFFVLFAMVYYGAAMSIVNDLESVRQQWDWREWLHLGKRIVVFK